MYIDISTKSYYNIQYDFVLDKGVTAMSEKFDWEAARFNNLSSEIEGAYHDAAQRLGLPDSTMRILYTVSGNGGSCMLSDICRLSGTSKQTINSALRRLEKDGIIILETVKGRRKCVYLTDKGKILSENTAERIIKAENETFGSWTDEERKIYIELTERFLKQFKDKISGLNNSGGTSL